MATQLKLVRITDSPAQKTVTCFLSDNSSIILKNMSGETNYTPPPGYGVLNGVPDIYRPLMTERYTEYLDQLYAQALEDNISLQERI